MKIVLQYSFALLLTILVCSAYEADAQGCVAVRNMSSWSLGAADSVQMNAWQFSLNYRYFRSYKHFRGSEEEEERVEQGTEVINNDNSVLFGITYALNRRWSLAAIIPYINVDRSSLYEYYVNESGNSLCHMHGLGLAD